MFDNELDLPVIWAATVTTGKMWVMAKSPASTEPSKSRGIEDDTLLQGRMTLRMALLVCSSYLSGWLTLVGSSRGDTEPGEGCAWRDFSDL